MSLVHEALRKAAAGNEPKTSNAARHGLGNAIIPSRRERRWTGPVMLVALLAVVVTAVAVPLSIYMISRMSDAAGGLMSPASAGAAPSAAAPAQPAVRHTAAEAIAAPQQPRTIEPAPQAAPVQAVELTRPQAPAPQQVAAPQQPAISTPLPVAAATEPATHPAAPAAASQQSPPATVDAPAVAVPIAEQAPAPRPVPAGPVLEAGREYVRKLNVTDAPELTLSGIAHSGALRMAFINGATAEAGDSVEGALVMKVEPKRVLMVYKDTPFTLRLP